MPFLTEELWQYLPRRANDKTVTICLADYPVTDLIHFSENAIIEVDLINLVIKSARSCCVSCNIVKKKVTSVLINTKNEKHHDTIQKYQDVIVTLAYLSDIKISLNGEEPQGCANEIVNESCTLFLPAELKKK